MKRQPSAVKKTFCIICDKPYQYKKIFWKPKEYPELMCYDFKTSHPACQKAYDKVQKLKNELTEAEYELSLIKPLKCPFDDSTMSE